MKLLELNFTPNPDNPPKTLSEGYGRTFDFDYHGNQVTDPRPKALSLGKWRSHQGNELMGGINLNYLSPEQVDRLQQNLQTILRRRSLKDRARTLRHLMPDVFNSAYRTYYKNAVDNVDPGTLRFAGAPKTEPTQLQDMDKPRPETAPDASTDAAEVDEPQPPERGIADKIKSRHERGKKAPEPEDIEPEDEPKDLGTDEIEPEELEEPEEPEDTDEEEV